MLSRKKFAAAAGLLSGIALTCAGVAQAYGDTTTKDSCTRGDHGAWSCVHVQKTETTYRTEDGTVHIHQSQNCSTESQNRVVHPEGASSGPSVTTVGPRVGCSVSASAPAHVQVPHVTVG